MYDFKLIVNENQEFKVHRAILSAGSDYFKTFFGKSSEQSNKNSLDLKTDEIEAFPWMIKFLYTGTLSTSTYTFNQIESLMKLAMTYQIPILLKTLIHLITEKIDANNCLRLLFMENYFQDQWVNIRKDAIQISAKNFLYICHQEEFVKLPFNILNEILDHVEILIPNQTMFHSALMRWSKNSTKIDEDDLLFEYLIPNRYQESFVKCNTIYLIPSSIVCFLADGSEKYTNMTINAMNSFLKVTPHVTIGLLLMNFETKGIILNQIDRMYHSRIICKRVSKSELIPNWNPTQFKMDIIKFASDGFQEIFWMDSDTICYKDMTSVLYDFHASNQSFYFIPDHVMFDKNFVESWRKQHSDTLIPQACFMGFKSSIISSFFLLWKESWMKWIEPKPFTNYSDPNSTFEGSAFCIEQYALGNAIHRFITKRSGTEILNDTLLTKYIKKIDRTLVVIDTKDFDQTKIVQERQKIMNLASTTSFCMTSIPLITVHFYSLIPYSYLSDQNVSQTSLRGSFPRIIGNLSSTPFSHVIDRYFDCFLHFYNRNYDIVYQWYLKNGSSL